jgi:transcription antitermination factor NusG
MDNVEVQSAEDQKDAWYAIYTKHQHERAAAEVLVRKGFKILLPQYRSVHRWKDRNKTVLLPLFPCYLFVQTDLGRKLDILRTPGVFWLVESGGCACPVPENDIEGISKIIQGPARIAPHPFLKSGERVRIRRGALEGIEGILIKLKNQYRVVLSVELLRKAVAVEIDLADVQLLPASEPGVSRAASCNLGQAQIHRVKRAAR